MSNSLEHVIQSAKAQEQGLSYQIPEDWKQGRTTYGGCTVALMYAAVMRAHGVAAPLRSVTVNFVAPISDGLQVQTELLRQGRNVTAISARGMDGNKVAAQATFTFGLPQDSQLSVGRPACEAPNPDTLTPLKPEMFGGGRSFFNNFELCPIEGAPLFSGADRGYLRVWARHTDPAMRAGMVGLLAIADLLPPAAFPMLRRPGPNSSVNWISNVMAEHPQTRDGWWMMETDLSAGADGYSSQVMRMWNTDGELVMDGMQSVLIFA